MIITLDNADHNIKLHMYGGTGEDGTNENLLWLAKQDKDKPDVNCYVWIAIALTAVIVALFILILRKKRAKTNDSE